MITATVDGKSAATQVTVVPAAVAAVSIAPARRGRWWPARRRRSTVVLKAERQHRALGARRSPSRHRQPLVAKVNALGQLVATSPGTTTITATSEGRLGHARGGRRRAGGLGGADDHVDLAGVARARRSRRRSTAADSSRRRRTQWRSTAWRPRVVAASPTSLTIVVPAAGLPCQSAQDAPVTVATVGGMATAKSSARASPRRARSRWVRASSPTRAGRSRCNELPAGGSYIVRCSMARRRRRPRRASTSVARRARRRRACRRAQPVGGHRADRRDGRVDGASPAQRAHIDRLEEDRALMERLGRAASRRRARRRTRGRAASPVPLAVGSTTTIKYHYSSCTAAGTTNITARVVYVGAASVVLEDVAGPLAGTLDADLVALADQFEQVSYPAAAQLRRSAGVRLEDGRERSHRDPVHAAGERVGRQPAGLRRRVRPLSRAAGSDGRGEQRGGDLLCARGDGHVVDEHVAERAARSGCVRCRRR